MINEQNALIIPGRVLRKTGVRLMTPWSSTKYFKKYLSNLYTNSEILQKD